MATAPIGPFLCDVPVTVALSSQAIAPQRECVVQDRLEEGATGADKTHRSRKWQIGNRKLAAACMAQRSAGPGAGDGATVEDDLAVDDDVVDADGRLGGIGRRAAIGDSEGI